jgi:hypothetical protein
MIDICPFCGRWLDKPIRYGVTTCQNCMRIVDGSIKNRLLSAAWACRKTNTSTEYIEYQYSLSKNYVDIIDRCLIKGEMCHDDFLREIKPLFRQAV